MGNHHLSRFQAAESATRGAFYAPGSGRSRGNKAEPVASVTDGFSFSVLVQPMTGAESSINPSPTGTVRRVLFPDIMGLTFDEHEKRAAVLSGGKPSIFPGELHGAPRKPLAPLVFEFVRGFHQSPKNVTNAKTG